MIPTYNADTKPPAHSTKSSLASQSTRAGEAPCRQTPDICATPPSSISKVCATTCTFNVSVGESFFARLVKESCSAKDLHILLAGTLWYACRRKCLMYLSSMGRLRSQPSTSHTANLWRRGKKYVYPCTIGDGGMQELCQFENIIDLDTTRLRESTSKNVQGSSFRTRCEQYHASTPETNVCRSSFVFRNLTLNLFVHRGPSTKQLKPKPRL